MTQPERIDVECLTDESGTGYAVSFYVGRQKVYSRWMALRSAEKLARTITEKFVGTDLPAALQPKPTTGRRPCIQIGCVGDCKKTALCPGCDGMPLPPPPNAPQGEPE